MDKIKPRETEGSMASEPKDPDAAEHGDNGSPKKNEDLKDTLEAWRFYRSSTRENPEDDKSHREASESF
ncbi:MAG: hypothetical protein NUV59_01030 [Patescibacteria group bacterium]|nr:hypothetical protein [Patescibacteria group bacterium]